MTSRHENDEIRRGRESLRSIVEKGEALRQTGGTLDRNGEPKLTADRDGNFTPVSPGADGSAARSSLRGSGDIARDPRLTLPTSDGHITGQVGGKEKGRPAQTTWGDDSFAPRKKQEAMLRPTKLNLPAVRSIRPANADGATSFHFAHEAISKTRFEKTTAHGIKNRKGAASDHTRYLERDEALARTDKDQLEKIENDLQRIAAGDPELARQLGLDPAKAKQAPQELAQAANSAWGVGGMASVYIEREEALAHDDNGIAVLFSNISENAGERRDFWKLVEQNESDPSDDKMRLLIAGHEGFWQKVADEDDCPKALKKAIAAARPDEVTVVKTRDNQLVREIMKRHGWKPREKRKASETDEERAAREEREAATSFGARFEDGRGGRVQFRIVGELPHEVDHDARVRILKGFTEEFERRSLPYIAVMHAPDHTNDDRNWHFHLVYHDRPAKRFTGVAADHLKPLDEKAGPKTRRQHELAQAAIDDPSIQGQIGQWDFTVPWTYKKAVSGNRIQTLPFEQTKDREVTRASFIPALRRQLATLTNNELGAGGHARRVDPRRYDQMGIEKEADEHLGTQASRFESLGVPTEKGLRNELNQWIYVQRNLEQKAAQAERDIERQLSRWSKLIAEVEPDARQRETIDREMIRWEQAARVAAEHKAIAENLEQHYERLKSRALKVKKVAEKHIKAIEENRATKRQAANLARYRAKLDEASIHLAGLKLLMVQEIAQIANSQAAARRHAEQAEISSDIVTAALKVSAERSAQAERAAVPGATAGKSATTAPPNDQDPALTQKEIGVRRYVEQLVKTNRRIVLDQGVLYPANLNSEDLKIVSDKSWATAQQRLAAIKREQDRQIAHLESALHGNPGMLQLKPDAPELEGSVSVKDRYRLGTYDKLVQAEFAKFGNEPEIRKFILMLEANQRALFASRKPEQAAPAEAPTKPTPTPTPTQAPAPVPVAPKIAAANDDERIISAMREKFVRPRMSRAGEAISVRFSQAEADALGLKERYLIDDKRTIARIEGVARANHRSVKRLVAYLEKNPKAAVEGEGDKPATISATAPAELREIAGNFATDRDIVRAMQNALINARVESVDPRLEQQAAKGGSASTPTPAVDDDIDWGPSRAKTRFVLPDLEPKKKTPAREGGTIPAEALERARQRGDLGLETPELVPYRRGRDATIDKWMDAHLARDYEERRRLSAIVGNDKRLKEMAERFEDGIRQTFEADWDRRQAGPATDEKGIDRSA